MERSYNSADVVCPFYRDDDCARRKIRCEGLTDGSSLTQYYRYRREFENQMRIFCKNHYEKCEVAALLLIKHEEELDLRARVRDGIALRGMAPADAESLKKG